MAFRAGDTVFHNPSGETWTLAIDEENGNVMWCGWPEGWAKASECELRTAAGDADRLDILRQVSRSRDDYGGLTRRASAALCLLHAERQCETPCALCTEERLRARADAERAVVEHSLATRRLEHRQMQVAYDAGDPRTTDARLGEPLCNMVVIALWRPLHDARICRDQALDALLALESKGGPR